MIFVLGALSLSAHLSLRKQNTIASEVQVSGFGYFNNKDVTLTLRPADAGSGIVFVRTDLDPQIRIPANVEHRIESPRRTVLSHLGATVEMIEHVMAALAGLQIDNCEVHTDAAEMPGCDGSSLPVIEALKSVGVEEQDLDRPQLIVTENTRVNDEHDGGWLEARPLGKKDKPGMHLQYRLDYGINHIIGRQTYRGLFSPEVFCEELAAARTYLLKEEADWMREQGLGTRVTYKDLLVFADPDGVIENELRFEDECVRHKTLDMVGDLALAGYDLVGQFIGCRSGHRLNSMLVKALLLEGHINDAPQALA